MNKGCGPHGGGAASAPLVDRLGFAVLVTSPATGSTLAWGPHRLGGRGSAGVVPLLTLAPRPFEVAGVAPSWAVLWLLPWL